MLAMIKKTYLAIFGVFLLGIIVGYGLGLSQGTRKINADLQEKLEKAKQLFPSVSDIRSLSGTVKSINGNVVNMEITGFLNPFEELPLMREIVITDATKIIMQTPKDFDLFQQEYAAYQKELEQALSPPILPAPFIEKVVAFADIKTGQPLSVESAENIKNKTRFEAVKVILLP